MGRHLIVPVLGFVGYSGSGKTTIIEKLAKRLVEKNLVVGYLKHDAHRLAVDREGKDTDRIFKSGVLSVAAVASDESFTRGRGGDAGLSAALRSLAHCDIVIAEGYKNAPWDKIWVHPHGGPPDSVPHLDHVIYEIGAAHASLRHDDSAVLVELVSYWLVRQRGVKPLYGGLLVGGKSSRMGSPKALLPAGDVTLSEKLYALLESHAKKVYLLGNGPLPASLLAAERISDAPDIEGPLAGLLSAHRFAPYADWLLFPVDMPNVDGAYMERLVSRRQTAVHFVGAHNPSADAPEPLGALYTSQLLHRISVSCGAERSISRILSALGVKGLPDLYDPVLLKNVNSQDDLR